MLVTRLRGLRRLSTPFAALLIFGAAGVLAVVIAFAVGPRGSAPGGQAPSIAPLTTASPSPSALSPSPDPTVCVPLAGHRKQAACFTASPPPTPGAGDGGD